MLLWTGHFLLDEESGPCPRRERPRPHRANRNARLFSLVPATTAPAVPAAVATPCATSAPVFPRLGFVHGQPPAIRFLVGEPLDGRLGLRVAVHLDKAEPLGPAGVPVRNDLGRLHSPERAEHLLQVAAA